jgi:hypothetical protein
MAGAGYRTFNAGEILTASNVQTYLQDQVVTVFASTSARTTAISSPAEGQVSYILADDTFYIYNGSAWIPYDTGWIAWTPTIGGLTQGTGSVTQCYYARIGKTIVAQGYITLGTGPTGISTFTVSLPVDHVNSNRSLATGTCAMRDSVAARTYSGTVSLLGSGPGTIRLQAQRSDATYAYQTAQTSAIPHSWTSGDYFSFTIMYQGV